MLKSFGHFERVHLAFGKIFNLLWLILYPVAQIFWALNGQKLNIQYVFKSGHCRKIRCLPCTTKIEYKIMNIESIKSTSL